MIGGYKKGQLVYIRRFGTNDKNKWYRGMVVADRRSSGGFGIMVYNFHKRKKKLCHVTELFAMENNKEC